MFKKTLKEKYLNKTIHFALVKHREGNGNSASPLYQIMGIWESKI